MIVSNSSDCETVVASDTTMPLNLLQLFIGMIATTTTSLRAEESKDESDWCRSRKRGDGASPEVLKVKLRVKLVKMVKLKEIVLVTSDLHCLPELSAPICSANCVDDRPPGSSVGDNDKELCDGNDCDDDQWS